MVELDLPFPPSVNTYWRKYGNRIVLSKQAKEFKAAVMSRRAGKFGDKRLGVSITLHAPTKRKYDLDNRLKALFDALQTAGVFDDDEQIDFINVQRGEIKKGGACVVKIWEVA
ncbi:hypothetical protein B0181_09235 [Moraxella caviae]|uniref:Crossover junction endodeoxyribonuclease rusA n=1 Tax=Moraxella caviae TaxID=34060 RepID=A0A1S9ZWV7_9GAMM|nr:RusA family crossover junction endodeoxyribonuclease [Moraxella caviae]OOR88002.1 hypothetical protein B0181_09235 [Moraxella caviae]STZ14024.1 Crossover junction endodeoxyribonuclease rusA [Moraxella caviae]STZ14496.1 Crossover junction endodeoxyribonuclease rusA [Moraxella caviae]VEW11324.1 Crossover junction endodeoxyribonuclease rusA [Moraxella caviae]VEW12840.1 Crossover junction endodeoxyribonuclease rusA [Moraxella caviae]